MHKKRCAKIDSEIVDQPGSMYAEITHWKNVWNGALRYVCLWAFDLANHPADRLATHWYEFCVNGTWSLPLN